MAYDSTYRKEYNQRPEVKERNRNYQREYSLKHPEKVAIRYARQDFKELASVNPEKAKQIVSEIEAEEGPRFKELILDGIPEKLKLKGAD